LGDPKTLPAADTLGLSLRVAPPFGADHVIAFDGISADQKQALHSLDGTRNLSQLWDFIRRSPDLNLAIFPFFTAANR